MTKRRHLVRGTLAVLAGCGLLVLQAALLSGLWAAPTGDPKSPSPPEIPEIMLIALAMGAGATAFNAPHRGRDAGAGTVGVVLLVLAAGGDLLAGAGARMVLLFSFFLLWPAGLFVFGSVALRAKRYPAWCRAFPLAAGVAWYPGLVAGWVLPIDASAAFAPVSALLGGTWIAFGFVLVRGYVVPERAPPTWIVLAPDDAPTGPPGR